MARRGGAPSVGVGGLGPMAGVVMILVGLVVVVAVMTFAPTIGGQIEAAQPDLAPTSDWNATHNTNLPSSATTYTDNVGMITLLITIIIIAIALGYLIGI